MENKNINENVDNINENIEIEEKENTTENAHVTKREIFDFLKKLILFAVLALVSSFAPTLQGIFMNMFGITAEISGVATACIQAGVATTFLHSNI